MVQPTELLGTWQLRRDVLDRRVGLSGTVTGTTTLRAVTPDEVVWTEAGTMTFDGRSTSVSRTLLVGRTPGLVRRIRGHGWAVHFADGRLFHDWVWGERVEHACAPDDYAGVLAGDVTQWTVRWDALGPAKDYRLDSVLERRTDPAD